jgi:hypothetical protein
VPVLGEPAQMIRFHITRSFLGCTALRHYWTTALALLPDLHFAVIGVYEGESTLVINYRNHRGELVNEVLTFDGDLVREGHGTYLGS